MGHRVLVFRKSSGMTAGNIAVSKRKTEWSVRKRAGYGKLSSTIPWVSTSCTAQTLRIRLCADFWVASIPAPGCMGGVVRWYNHIHKPHGESTNLPVFLSHSDHLHSARSQGPWLRNTVPTHPVQKLDLCWSGTERTMCVKTIPSRIEGVSFSYHWVFTAREFSFFLCIFYNGGVILSQGRAWLYLWTPCWPIYPQVKEAKVTTLDSHWPSTSILARFLSMARTIVSILRLPDSTQEKEDSLDQSHKVSYPWLRSQNLRLPDSPKCSKQNKAPCLPGLIKLNG